MDTEKVFIIAELSANHGKDIEIAKETVRAAKRAGANAIKLQTYKAETITMDVKHPSFLIDTGGAGDGMYLFDLYKDAYLPWEWHKVLFDVAKEEGIICFSSPFDFTAVDFLEELECPIYKIASYEITDIPLIRYAASKGKPMIISTGIAGMEDIQMAIDACKAEKNEDITILKCTSAYPASIDEANLSMIKDIKERFSVKVGLSDHTLGVLVPALSVTMGAEVIEKHFILDKKVGGYDASFSLDEKEFTEMVSAVRSAESAIGKVSYELTKQQIIGRKSSRSLFVAEDIKKGGIFTNKNIRSVRPGIGLHPKYYHEVLGKTINIDASKGEPLKLEMIDGL
jgi:pseudaminic acid synthase